MTKNLLATAVVLIACMAAPRLAQATDDCAAGAGVIAYAIKDAQILILLAYDPDIVEKDGKPRGWGTMGGCMKKGEKAIRAARREFQEETRCAYKKRDVALKPNRVVSNKKFSAFVGKIPYKSALKLAMHKEKGCVGGVYAERGPLMWIPLQRLLTFAAQKTWAPESPAHRWFPHGTRLFRAAIKLVEDAFNKGMFPKPKKKKKRARP